jgi:hypothetical protein
VSAVSEVMIDLFTIDRLGWSAYREDSGEVCHCASRGRGHMITISISL